MKLRRFLAALLLLSMIVSIVPTSVFAVDTNDGSNNVSSGETTATAVGSVVAPKDNLFLSNIAKLEADGTYTINLSAYATAGRITQTLESGYPLDVVLVISQTGTLHENGKTYDGAPLAALKQSVYDFVEGLKADGEANGHKHRIAICGYASDEYGGWDNMVNKDTGALYGYSFAGDQKDWIFTNTGLFVNGKFKNYGSGTHTPLTEEEKAVDKLMDGTTFVAKANEAYQETLGDQYYIIKYEQSKKQWYYFRYSDFDKLYGSPTVDKVVNKVTTTPEDAVAWLTERFDLYKHDNTITYNLGADDYRDSWEYVSDNGELNEDITNAIDSLAANGGRYAFYGLKMARQMLKNAPDIEGEEGVERKKIVIVFANDQFGSNGDTNNNSVRAEAQKIKSDPEDGAEIYTVGINNSGPTSTFWSTMEMMSSDAYTYAMTTTGKHTAYATSTGNRLVKNNLVRFTGLFFYMVTNDDGTVDYYPVIAYSDPGPTNHKWYYVTDTGKVHIESNDGKDSLGGLYHIDSNSFDAAAGYCLRSDDYNDLSGLFLSVIEKSKICHNGKLDKQSQLKYVLADNFKLTEKSTITVSVVPGSVSEENSNLSPKELTSDKITWVEAQQLLSYSYDTSSHSYRDYIVPGAADQTTMTIYARASATGEIVFTGFNYALQCIYADHAGSKLEVKITGVEAKPGVATNTEEFINHNTSGIYEGTDRDWDGDGTKGNIQMVLPDTKTYLPAVTYQVNNDGSVTIDPKDFSAAHVSPGGYNYFATPCTTISTEYGQVTINNDGTVTYEKFHPEWEHNDVFYLFGKIDNTNVEGASTNVADYMWYKITIVDSEDSRGSLFLDKTATLTKNGTYTIDLEAYATGTPSKSIVSEGIPLDVVLVIDQSGSLAYEKYEDGEKNFNGAALKRLKASVTEFVDILKANGEAYGINHRISMCGFASGERQGTSGTTYVSGFTYASDLRQEAWCNTGLFVDGKFREYGTMEYVPVEKMEDLDINRYYSVYIDPDGDGNYEYAEAYYYPRYTAWVFSYGYRSAYLAQAEDQETATQLFWDKYQGHIYLPGKSTLQLTDADYAASWENIASGENGQGGVNPDITNAIDKLAANGATFTIYGLKMARHMLNNIPNLNDGVERKKVVIVFTDGVPGGNGITDGDADAALSEAMKIKNENIEIYAIGVYQDPSSSEVHDFMNRLSSNYYSHSFATETVRIDMSQIKYNDRSGNTNLRPTMGGSYPDRNGTSGITPYYYEKDGAYYPIVISNNYENPDVYYASYISDEVQAGGVLIGYGDWDKIPEIVGPVYMLTEHKINKGSDTNYYRYSDRIDDMTEMFEKIASKVTSNSIEVSLGVEAIMKDVLANGFELTDNTTITVSVVPGTVRDDCQDLPTHMLTAEKINWGNKTQVLSFEYRQTHTGNGTVVVDGAVDQTPMTLTATVENGVISVTGFNYAAPLDGVDNAQYINAGHPGSKLVVTITGVEAVENIVTGSTTVTNKGTSGIYEGPGSDIDRDGEKGEMQASFPIPTTHLTSKVYVVDYAKPMTIDPADFKMTKAAESLDVDGYNYFNPAITAITEKYGKVAVESGKVTYTPTNTNWDGFDTFFVFGATDDATIKAATANENGNVWSKVSVIPANNVYYEDTFVTNENTGTVGIVYTGSWTEVGTSGNQGENAESGEDTTADGAQGGVHGWEDTLADDTGYSDGSAHMVSYDPNSSATATFTFTGTGVDIYSRTNRTTGIVIAMLYEGDSTTDEDGKNLVAKYTLMVDNLAASGDYYQIPTLSLCQIPAKDDNGKIIKDENGNTVMVDMPHGTYTVKIIVSKASDSQTGAERFLYYLDGIRVYNPIQNLEGNDTVSGAYGEEELNATFVEIRDKLLDAGSFSAEDEESAGPVFIDRITSEEGDHTDNTETFEIGTYKVFGPENEVYLSAGQMIAFAVPYKAGAHYYIGMKTLTGDPADVWVSTPSSGEFMDILTIGHTTDLYYEVVPAWEYDEAGNPTVGIIIVTADIINGDFAMDENGDRTYEGAILALTKLKVTGPDAKRFKFAKVSNSTLLSYANSISTGPDAPDDEEPEDSEPVVPDVEIDNPKPEQPELDPQDIAKKRMKEMLQKIFAYLGSWFSN